MEPFPAHGNERQAAARSHQASGLGEEDEFVSFVSAAHQVVGNAERFRGPVVVQSQRLVEQDEGHRATRCQGFPQLAEIEGYMSYLNQDKRPSCQRPLSGHCSRRDRAQLRDETGFGYLAKEVGAEQAPCFALEGVVAIEARPDPGASHGLGNA